VKPQDRIHRSPRLSGAPGVSPDRPPMLLGQLGKGARVRLVCGFCGWSRSYSPYALIARLKEKAVGGPQTAIAHVARHVQWPCPMCHRMGWSTQPTSPSAAALAGGGPPAAERAVEGEAVRRAPARPSRTLITKRARALRKEMSKPEVMLWSRLRGRTSDRPTFRRQHPIGTIIVDFFCPSALLAIEVDGRTHWDDDARAQDAARDAWLESQGIATLRLPAGEVYRDLGAAVDAILRRVSERLAGRRN
jgi:very-short-patch-repair endonuclease